MPVVGLTDSPLAFYFDVLKPKQEALVKVRKPYQRIEKSEFDA